MDTVTRLKVIRVIHCDKRTQVQACTTHTSNKSKKTTQHNKTTQ